MQRKFLLGGFPTRPRSPERSSRKVSRHVSAVSAAALMLSVAPALLSATPADASPTRAVTFHGYRITVPASWPVIDLAANPSTCVRFDRHAVYLGHPGTAQSCPARLLGKTEALLVEPLDQKSTARVTTRTVRPAPGSVAVSHLPDTISHKATVAVDRAGVLVTASYGDDHATVARILAGATLTSGATPSTRTDGEPSLTPSVTTSVVVPGTFSGMGFDACEAPSSTKMATWKASSPYSAVAVYIGGASRACDQPNLTASWVSQQTTAGWHVIPTYVGLQAPCTGFTNRIDPATAASQGSASADDAVTLAQSLGIGAGSTIYDDMEFFAGDFSCQAAVFTFLNAWTNRLHALGYASGVYSSASGAIDDLVSIYYSTSVTPPDSIWIAHWDSPADVSDPAVPDAYWSNHQRIKQYRSGHDEVYGGVSINIDSDVLDVSVSGPPPAFPTVRQTVSVTVGDEFHLFAQGSSGELLETVYQPTTGWSGWVSHPGLTIAGSPSVVVEGQDMHVFARGIDGQIYQTDHQPDAGWTPWTSLGGDMAGDPAAVVNDAGEIHLFARGTDGAIHQADFQPATGWSDWSSLGGLLAGDPTAIVYGTDQIDLFARSTNGAIYQLVYTPTQGWSGWIKLGGVLAGDPTVIIYATDQIHLFARSTNGAIYQLRYTPTQGWSAWIKLGGLLAGDPAAVIYGTNQIHLFARGTDGAVNQLRYVPGQGWLPWIGLGGVVTGDPSVTLYGSGVQMFDFGTNGRVYGDSYASGAGWSGWQSRLL